MNHTIVVVIIVAYILNITYTNRINRHKYRVKAYYTIVMGYIRILK